MTNRKQKRRESVGCCGQIENIKRQSLDIMNKAVLFEVIPVRVFLIVMLVFYHAFAIFSGVWAPITNYPLIPAYDIIDKLSCATLLETFVFISGSILGFQLRTKGKDKVLTPRNLLWGKLKRLIVPSIVFSILYIICFGSSSDSILKVSYDVLNGVGHMWFLPMLFWCFVLTYLIELTGLEFKYVLPILCLATLGSVTPLPLRLNSALYYLLFFYAGFYIEKNSVTIRLKTEIVLPISLLLFAITFILKLNVENANFNIMGGGYLISNQIINKGIRIIVIVFSRVLCASFGIVSLMSLSRLLVLHSDTSKWDGVIKLSNCCFGVYIFQQFILKLLNKSILPFCIDAYLYPWIAFIITLFISLILTILIRTTKLGRQLL